MLHIPLFLLSLLALTVSGQQSIELLNLCETTHDILQASSHDDLPLAVSVSDKDLNGVSATILLAETWLRHNVLAHYPAAKITTIVVGTTAFCQQNQQQNLSMVLSSLKNVYHSLRRWGLDKDIKVSVAFHLDCLRLNLVSYDDDLKLVKPVVEFLKSVNSTFSLIPHSHFSDKSLSLVFSHMKKLGFLYISKINVVTKGGKTPARKLSAVDSSPMSVTVPCILQSPTSVGENKGAHALGYI